MAEAATKIRCPTCGRDDFRSERGLKRHEVSKHGSAQADGDYVPLARAVKSCFPEGIQTKNLRQLAADLEWVRGLEDRLRR